MTERLLWSPAIIALFSHKNPLGLLHGVSLMRNATGG